MEFIIVFPIYLVLFGAVFAIGDMLIHSNRLASGDRINAFDVEGWNDGSAWRFFSSHVFDAGREVDELGYRQDSLSRTNGGRSGCIYADLDGAWTVCAGSQVTDQYRLPAGGALGQLLYADRFFNQALTGPANLRTRDSLLSQIERGTETDRTGYVMMRSKGGNLINGNDYGSYSFYTLKRRRNNVLSWRDFTSGLLKVDPNSPNHESYWQTQVAYESWHNVQTIRSNRGFCLPVSLHNDLHGGYNRDIRFKNCSE